MGEFLLKSIMEGWSNYFGRDPMFDRIAIERARECVRCPHSKKSVALAHLVPDQRAPDAKGLVCDLCGCPISAKARRREEKCPDGRWNDNEAKEKMDITSLIQISHLQRASILQMNDRLEGMKAQHSSRLDDIEELQEEILGIASTIEKMVASIGIAMEDRSFPKLPPPLGGAFWEKIGSMVTPISMCQQWFTSMSDRNKMDAVIKDGAPMEMPDTFHSEAATGSNGCGNVLNMIASHIASVR